MRQATISAAAMALVFVAAAGIELARAQDLPAPGAKGNADNVPYIGRSDPGGKALKSALCRVRSASPSASCRRPACTRPLSLTSSSTKRHAAA